MILLPLLLCIISQDLDVPAPALDTIDHALLDAIVAEHEGEDQPGFTAALCRDGKVIWTNSCGEASLEWGVPNTRDTVFRLASTSKQFTAAAILMLALDGKISLDEPMAKYLPEFNGSSPMPTVRQMMNHTSGLRDYLNLMGLMDYDFESQIELEEVLDILLLQKGLNFEPGTDWSYSNSNYVLMSVIVERVSGQGLSEFTEERIFEPLGMADTLWLDDADRVIEHRAWGYEPQGSGFKRSGTRIEILGDGALASTVVDLAKWAEVLIDPPKDWAPLVAAMHVGPSTNEDDGARYGAGLVIDTFHGLPRVQHGGAFVGFRCQMAHLPDQNLTAICLANNGSFNPSSITNALLEASLGDALPEDVEPDTKTEEPAEEPPKDNSKEGRKKRRAMNKAKRRPPTDQEVAGIVGSYVCPELRVECEIRLDESGKLRVFKSDGSESGLLLRRKTGEAITHGFIFGLPIELEFDAQGSLIGGTLNAGRAKGMRIERRPDEASGK